MAIDNDIKTHLDSIAVLTAIIPAASIYWASSPQEDDYPRLVYRRISDPTLYDSDDRWQRWRFFIYHGDKGKCEEVEQILHDYLNRKDDSIGTLDVDYVQCLERSDPEFDNDLRVYWSFIDFRIIYH